MATLYARCPHCTQVKAPSDFYFTRRSGRSSWCKECMRAKQRDHRAAKRGLSRDEQDATYQQWCARQADRELLALRGMARCPVCLEAKPQEEFYPDRRRKTGFECRCKECGQARAQRYRWDPLTARRGKGQLRLFPLDKKCPCCGRKKPLYDFGCYDGAPYGHGPYCRACNCALSSRYAAAHPEWKPRKRAARRAKYAADPNFRATVKLRSKEWYDAHPEQARARNMAWKAAHPEQVRLVQRKHKLLRRTLMKGIEGEHGIADLRLIYEAQRGLCAYCLVPLPQASHVDHMTAITRGGTDWPWNLCLTCPRCNCRKQAMSAGQFLALLHRENR